MVTIECDLCGATQDFPSTLTVVDEPIEGWALEVETEDSHLRVTAAYCESCQEDA